MNVCVKYVLELCCVYTLLFSARYYKLNDSFKNPRRSKPWRVNKKRKRRGEFNGSYQITGILRIASNGVTNVPWLWGPFQKLIDHQKRLNIFGQSFQNGEHKAQENNNKFQKIVKANDMRKNFVKQFT